MPTSPIDSRCTPVRARGFTLLELVVALVVVSILAVISLPSLERMGDSMRYREAVRDLVNAAKTARRDAFAEGRAFDLLVSTDQPGWALLPSVRSHEVLDADFELEPLPEGLTFDAVYAAEVSPGRDVASIRFYPSGGASGGDIDILRANGTGERLKIDWLLGQVTQVPVEL